MMFDPRSRPTTILEGQPVLVALFYFGLPSAPRGVRADLRALTARQRRANSSRIPAISILFRSLFSKNRVFRVSCG